MKTIFVITINLLFSYYVQAQTMERQVTAAAGENYQTPNASLQYTLGEPVITTLHADYQLTQGFHQAWLIITSVEDHAPADWNIHVYPNPTLGMVHIDAPSTVVVTVFDMMGKMVVTKSIEEHEDEIDISSLSTGTYLMMLTDPATQQQKTFKVSKVE